MKQIRCYPITNWFLPQSEYKQVMAGETNRRKQRSKIQTYRGEKKKPKQKVVHRLLRSN